MKLTVRNIMQTNVETIGPRESLATLQIALLKANVGGLPVVESGQILGIASRSDVVRKLKSEREMAMRRIGLPPEFHLTTDDAIDLGEEVGERLEELRVEHVMNPAIISVSPDASIQFAAELLTQNHIHRLPVVENNDLVGLITSHDIVQLVAEHKLTETGD